MVGGLLVGVWWKAARASGATERATLRGGSSAGLPPGSSLRAALADSGASDLGAGASDEFGLFRELVRAREAVLREVASKVPSRKGFFPTSPGLLTEKALARRAWLVKGRFAELLDEIAQKRGVGREELEDLYRRGLAEGWRTRP